MTKKFLLVTTIVILLAGLIVKAEAIVHAKDLSVHTTWPATGLPSTLDLAGFEPGADSQAINRKLDGVLARLAGTQDDRAVLAESAGLRLEHGRVQVQLVIEPATEDKAREAVNDAGGVVTTEFEGLLQAWLPPEQLPALAALPFIEYIRPPDTAIPEESDSITAMSEGVAAANAAAWQLAGWRGQGVRIAVIDAGFQGYSTKLGTELPDIVTVKNFVDGQPDAEVGATTLHGTACAEIIHDMAPQAELFLLKISTDLDLNEAVDYAISRDVDVISTSLTFVNVTPGDGTGRFSTMAQKARNAGILWVTAAGNYRETHWSGAFTDGDGDGLHEYAPGIEVNVFGPGNNTAFQIPGGVVLSPSIRWNDWTDVDQDFRLLLLRYNGSTFEIVSSSNNPQTGLPGQRPTERATYITSGTPAIYGVAIQRVNATRAVHMHLLTPNRELDQRVAATSLGNLADVSSVLTVAAVDVDIPFVREDYSSEGPTDGPGGAPTGGQLKPDLAAFANVSTASYGIHAFNGTSAATPHVAGAAAQVLSAYPTGLPAEIQDFLQTRAVNQGLPGPDPQYGFGRLHLGAPPGPWDYPYHLFVPYVIVQP